LGSRYLLIVTKFRNDSFIYGVIKKIFGRGQKVCITLRCTCEKNGTS